MTQARSVVHKAKIWLGIGSVAALGAASSALATAQSEAGAGSAAVEGNFQGDFKDALEKILAGEGGEGGAGLTKMWPTISAPALTGDQIREAVSGNTLSVPHHYTMQFAPDGTMGGYDVGLQGAPVGKSCPKPEVQGDGFISWEGECYTRTLAPWEGTWKIHEHRLCVDVTWQGGAIKDCWHVAILLDRIALFDPSGKIYGKGNTLRKGKALDE